jgi:hypothetical protein
MCFIISGNSCTLLTADSNALLIHGITMQYSIIKLGYLVCVYYYGIYNSNYLARHSMHISLHWAQLSKYYPTKAFNKCTCQIQFASHAGFCVAATRDRPYPHIPKWLGERAALLRRSKVSMLPQTTTLCPEAYQRIVPLQIWNTVHGK